MEIPFHLYSYRQYFINPSSNHSFFFVFCLVTMKSLNTEPTTTNERRTKKNRINKSKTKL